MQRQRTIHAKIHHPHHHEGFQPEETRQHVNALCQVLLLIDRSCQPTSLIAQSSHLLQIHQVSVLLEAQQRDVEQQALLLQLHQFIVLCACLQIWCPPVTGQATAWQDPQGCCFEQVLRQREGAVIHKSTCVELVDLHPWDQACPSNSDREDASCERHSWGVLEGEQEWVLLKDQPYHAVWTLCLLPFQ